MKAPNNDSSLLSDSELYNNAFELLFRSLNNIKINEKFLEKIYIESSERGSDIYEKALFDAEMTSDTLIIKRHEYLKPEEKEYYQKNNQFDFICQQDLKYYDYSEILKSLEINKGDLLIIEVNGDSMTGAGFEDGDLVFVDTVQKATDNSVVIAKLNGNMYVKRIKILKGNTWLYSENTKYSPFKVRSQDEFHIFGVVKSIIKKVV